MTRDPRAFFALDLGAATASAALVARLAGRWRLLGALALPAQVGDQVVRRTLLERLARADPGMAASIGIEPAAIEHIPSVTVRSGSPRRLAVVAASERALAPLVRSAVHAGWAVRSGSAATLDPLEMSRLLLDPEVDALLAGAGDPPGADERGALPELAALVASVAERRPDVTVVLAGAMTDSLDRFGDVMTRPGEVLLGAAARTDGDERGLGELLGELALPPDDSRRAAVVAVATLADLTTRRVEYVEIGYDAGVRAIARPGLGRDAATVRSAVVVDAALAPLDADDDGMLGRVLDWSTLSLDRHRLRDRLRELRINPWAATGGDGAAVRLAAGRAALGRLLEATADLDAGEAPDLVVAAGGAWALAPGPVVTLALSDVLRRPGATQYAHDHARLLGPLGSIADPDERRSVLADLADDLLVPLGSVVTPAGLRSGRSAGRLVVHAAGGTTELELMPGALELVDLAPGQTAVADFQFRDTVHLGAKGRQFEVEVAGGLGGLLVDMRDVPLRLPERHDRRREQLDTWQRSVWAGRDR